MIKIGRLIGKYYNARKVYSKKVKKFKKNVRSSISALRSIWANSQQDQKPKIENLQRINRFFHYCEDIENHPFYCAYKNGGQIKLDVKVDPTGDYVSVNFDEYHLESLLTRLRQFLFESELYFFDDVAASVRVFFGSDCIFEDFLRKVTLYFDKPLVPLKSGIQVFLPNGEEAVGGRNIYELIEMELYTGRIHSQHSADPKSAFFPLANANPIVRKNVTYYLGVGAMNTATNVLIYRNHILRLARNSGKTGVFKKLEDFDSENKRLGY